MRFCGRTSCLVRALTQLNVCSTETDEAAKIDLEAFVKHKKAAFSMVPRYWHNAVRGRALVLVMLLMQLLQQAQGTRAHNYITANIGASQRKLDLCSCVEVAEGGGPVRRRRAREPSASQATGCRPAPHASIWRGVHESKLGAQACLADVLLLPAACLGPLAVSHLSPIECAGSRSHGMG